MLFKIALAYLVPNGLCLAFGSESDVSGSVLSAAIYIISHQPSASRNSLAKCPLTLDITQSAPLFTSVVNSTSYTHEEGEQRTRCSAAS